MAAAAAAATAFHSHLRMQIDADADARRSGGGTGLVVVEVEVTMAMMMKDPGDAKLAISRRCQRSCDPLLPYKLQPQPFSGSHMDSHPLAGFQSSEVCEGDDGCDSWHA